MNNKIVSVFCVLNLAMTILTNGADWKINWQIAQGTGGIQSQDKHSGKYALKTSAQNDTDKVLFLRTPRIRVQPGEKYTLSGWAKSTTANPSNARIILQYLNRKGEYTTCSRGLYCGGSHEWQKFSQQEIIPEGVEFVRIVAGSYSGAGTSWFDDIELKEANDNTSTLATDGFEDFIEPSKENVWRIPVKAAKSKINAVVDITEISVNTDLVHYTGPDSLKDLSVTCSYNVVRPGNCYLSSDHDTSYWYTMNLKKLTMSLGHSTEKLDLSIPGQHITNVPFKSRYVRYFDPIEKGESCVRGHHYFTIYDENGNKISTTKSANALVSPEANAFGKRQTRLSTSNRKSLYTIANLDKYELFIDSFRANWKPGGKFAFKIKIKDANGDIFDINKVTAVTGDVDSEHIKSISQKFAPYDIPTGWYVGSFPAKDKPNELTVKAVITSAKNNIITTNNIIAKFTPADKYPAFSLNMPEHKSFNSTKEIRLAMMALNHVVSENPEEGKKQIREIVAKAKKSNINILSPFAIGNRTTATFDIDNKYFTRIFTNYDPLAVLRAECTKAGIELHPLVCTLPEGAETLKGILADHPEWAMRSGGKRKGWLDPAVPAVREYRLKDIVNLARKYKLEGVCLDYCRLAVGPSDAGAEIYKKMTGKDARLFKYGTDDYIEWYKWESEQLNEFVKMIHTELHKINPDIKLSAYIQGDKYSGDYAWENLDQDFLAWLREGSLDWVFPTGYIYDMLRFKIWCKRQIDASNKANPQILCAPTIGVISSHGALQNSDELIEQINIIRDLGASGVSFFRWEKLRDWLTPLHESCFQKPVTIP